MSTLLRLLSPTYRHAIKAEAEGRYIDAARAYALSGQRRKVAEMHLLEAEKRGSAASALQELKIAAHFLAADATADQALLRRVGQAYFRCLSKSVLSAADRDLLDEAAQLLVRGGDPTTAAAVYELSGDTERAAAMYQQAGEVDKVEALLENQAQVRQRVHAERDALATYRAHLDLGRREEALAALHTGLASAAVADRAEPLRLYEELKARLLTTGVVRLRTTSITDPAPESLPAQVRVFVGTLPLRIGREVTSALPLRDPGVSREHAQIEQAPDGTFALRELTAKNGTRLGGLLLHPGTTLPLRDSGDIGIGQHVTLRFQVHEKALTLEVAQGLDRGLTLHAASGPQKLGDGLPELYFERGRPFLRMPDSTPCAFNGKRAPQQVQLIRGDLIELAGQRIEVL